MDARLIELVERRERLVARAAIQRAEFARRLDPWRAPVAVIDQGVAVYQYLKARPAIVVGVLAFLLALRPRNGVKWLRRGWMLWQTVRYLKRRMLGIQNGPFSMPF